MTLCCDLVSLLGSCGEGRAERLTDYHLTEHIELVSKSHISAITEIDEVAKDQIPYLICDEELGP
jgi:hypothetical protein